MIHNGFIIIETQWIHKGLGNNGFGSLQSRDDSNILQNLKFQNFPVPTMPRSFIPEQSSETVALHGPTGPRTDATPARAVHGPTGPRTHHGHPRERSVPEKLTTQRRRHDDDTTNTTRTLVQPQTPTINGNSSLRIREKVGIHFRSPMLIDLRLNSRESKLSYPIFVAHGSSSDSTERPNSCPSLDMIAPGQKLRKIHKF